MWTVTAIEGPHRGAGVVTGGAAREATRALVMLHGRGADAHDILGLAGELTLPGVSTFAPNARGGTWYPYSFLAPLERNEPHLSSALALVEAVVETLERERGIARRDVFLLGFSQGACLALEYAARHATRYGGILALSGGLIGPDESPRDYAGGFDGTPVFLGCSDVDPHIPARRVAESRRVLEGMGAEVEMRLYAGMGHVVNRDELSVIQRVLDGEPMPGAPDARRAGDERSEDRPGDDLRSI